MALLATLNNKIANKISVNFTFNDIYVFKTCFQGRRVYIGVIKGKGGRKGRRNEIERG